MSIKELFEYAVIEKEFSLCLLLDFLVNEKKTVKMSDDMSVLDHYTKPNNRARMNQLLDEYRDRKIHDENWIVRRASKL
jgi:response regulator of citrate/malate metabolism